VAGLLTSSAAAKPDAVALELQRWAREPFDPVTANCGLSILDYAERITGGVVNPSPRHLNGFAMLALAADPDQFLDYASWILAQLGCAITEKPVRGDVGLADLAGSGLTAALCLGDGQWAARMAHGLAIGPAPARRAWEVRRCPKR